METSRRPRKVTKQRRIKHRLRDTPHGNVTGFIDVAQNLGEVTEYSETVYMGEAEGSIEPFQLPSHSHKNRTQNESYAAEHDIEDAESPDDDDRGGAEFYGQISGFVREARGTGNAIAMKKVMYGTSRENSLIDSRGAAVQRHLYSPEESSIVSTEHAQSWADSQQEQEFDMGSLTNEFQNLSPEMQRFIGSTARQDSHQEQEFDMG